MIDSTVALIFGATSGLLALVSLRFPILGWLVFAPLGVALSQASVAGAALAGAVAGALANSREIADRTMRLFGFLAAAISAAVWALGFGIAAWVTPPESAWLTLALPLTVLLVHVPLRAVGAPGWHSNPIGQAQGRFLTIVHTARIGGDLTPTVLLALSGAAIAMVLIDPTPSAANAVSFGACAVVLGGMLAFGRRSLGAAIRRVRAARTVRVAAVVANGRRPNGDVSGTWPIESSEYRDVQATLDRYRPHVHAAAEQGAELVLLPEVCVTVDEYSRQRFVDEVASWARAKRVAVVLPYFDRSVPKNELVVIDSFGSIVERYEKQHPVAHVEGRRTRRMRPGPTLVTLGARQVALSTVICVDLDYRDLIAPVRRAGGILLAPSNDWPGFDELHHQSAVWPAVATGVSLVRATGWGISAAYDGAGHVLGRATSHDAPVVLVVDAPIA